MAFDYNVSYRSKDKGIQVIVSYKNSNNQWKQISRQGFKTKREAKTIVEELIIKAKLLSNVVSTTQTKNITFKEFADKYIDHMSLYLKKSTIVNYDNSIKKFKPLYNLKLKDITMLDIQNCIDDAIREGIKVSTLKVYLISLNKIFSSAVDDYHLILENPYSKPKLLIDKSTTERQALTMLELDDLISKLKNERLRVVTIIAAYSGLRIGEILGLTWDCIDFENKLITVNKQWNLLNDGTHGFTTLKSKNSNRVIPFSHSLKKELLEYKKKYPLNFDNRLFKYTRTNGVASNLKSNYKLCGYNIGIHNLRHTYATMLIANNVDFKTTAKLLGHTVEMTLTVYSHVTDEMQKRATNIIENIF